MFYLFRVQSVAIAQQIGRTNIYLADGTTDQEVFDINSILFVNTFNTIYLTRT